MQYENGDYVLSTGRRIYANSGVLGISASAWGSDGADIDVFEGYDGDLSPDGGGEFTAEERAEIADYVIGLWQRWKEKSA